MWLSVKCIFAIVGFGFVDRVYWYFVQSYFVSSSGSSSPMVLFLSRKTNTSRSEHKVVFKFHVFIFHRPDQQFCKKKNWFVPNLLEAAKKKAYCLSHVMFFSLIQQMENDIRISAINYLLNWLYFGCFTVKNCSWIPDRPSLIDSHVFLKSCSGFWMSLIGTRTWTVNWGSASPD